MDWDALKTDWRIWVLVAFLLLSFGLILEPTDPYTTDDDGNVQLNTNINQGLDLQGGIRLLIEPQPEEGEEVTQEMVQQIIDTLETRVQAFGLMEMTIRQVEIDNEYFVQVEMAGEDTEGVQELINRTGEFEAHIPITVEDGDEFTLGSGAGAQTYTAQMDGEQVTVDGETYTPGDEFQLSSGARDVPFRYTNNTEAGAELAAIAFTGEEVLGVDVDQQSSGVTCRGGSCQFQFVVSVTDEAAERTHDILQNFPRGAQYLQGANLVFYLDDEQISSLQIRNTFKDSPVRQPMITGSEPSQEEARDESQQLQSVLRSGALPVPIEIVSTNTVSPTLGAAFLQTSVIAILVAIAAVAGLIVLRYQDLRIAAPLLMTSFSELIIILGFAAATGWDIDLPSIAGIIAAVGTGVDDQIVITDERGKTRQIQSMKERFKRAFFIIFTAAASTIGAMIPLTQIGAGAITGFAVTTIVGVIAGVFITRPAYARVLQYMDD